MTKHIRLNTAVPAAHKTLLTLNDDSETLSVSLTRDMASRADDFFDVGHTERVKV